MQNTNHISTNRIEAFSDGVIAIIITIMVFDLKLQELDASKELWAQVKPLLPKFLSYALSFLTIAIMWVNHHQLFHQVRHTDRKLPWYNNLLLFWMSLIPFATNFVGANPMEPWASATYGLVLLACAVSFYLLRNYASVKAQLLHHTISNAGIRRSRKKNWLGIGLYAAAVFSSFLSVYLSYVLFLVVPAIYFIPEKIIHDKKQEQS